MALGKEELLAAIAAAGTAGRTAYEQAQAQIASQQQEAVRAALASAVGATSEGQAEISRIIGTGYAPRQAQITSNLATMNDWYERQKAMQGSFLDNANRIGDLAAMEAAVARSSGGGGGGGKEPVAPNWYDELKDVFGTAELAKTGILGEVQNDWHTSGIPNYQAAQKYAVEKYGVPRGVAADWYQPDEYLTDLQTSLQNRKDGLGSFGNTKKGLRKFTQAVRAASRKYPGQNTGYYNNLLIQQKRAQVQAAQRRRNKGRGSR